ncbi:hypothetical protein FBZ83_1295 [Azospirillum brasilense]|uniref:Uncharacterized protein n=1 Tax=Azospirillum brasilense TaxID=192 RepID=A0A560BM62_AZOBR|nr:hypothetical protein [Azospirillum brasilense]TWA73713.1 hypothetical protein FBZ83_1295 [Azospirillum brasilense]
MEKDSLYNDHAVAIGRLSIAFNELEQYLLLAIGTLLGDPTVGVVVGGDLTYAQRLALINKLIEHRQIDVSNLSDFLSRLENIRGERNRYLHSEYELDLDDNEELVGVLVKDNRRRRAKTVSFTVSDPNEIMRAAREARNLASAFPFMLDQLMPPIKEA